MPGIAGALRRESRGWFASGRMDRDVVPGRLLDIKSDSEPSGADSKSGVSLHGLSAVVVIH
jgi:hypothetical protein